MYVIRIDHLIYIEKDAWEVALVEIITPSQVMNISEENNYFFLAFLDQRIYNTDENSVTEMCTLDDTCDKYKLFIPVDNYTTPQHLAEEMQSSIDAFERDLLRQANAHIHISYNDTSNRMKVVAQNEKEVRLLFPKDFGDILGVNPAMTEKSIGNE